MYLKRALHLCVRNHANSHVELSVDWTAGLRTEAAFYPLRDCNNHTCIVLVSLAFSGGDKVEVDAMEDIFLCFSG